jgi:hypothetical protein
VDELVSWWSGGQRCYQVPLSTVVRLVCHTPALVPPPVFDSLRLGLGYNLSLQCKEEKLTLTTYAKTSVHLHTN